MSAPKSACAVADDPLMAAFDNASLDTKALAIGRRAAEISAEIAERATREG